MFKIFGVLQRYSTKTKEAISLKKVEKIKTIKRKEIFNTVYQIADELCVVINSHATNPSVNNIKEIERIKFKLTHVLESTGKSEKMAVERLVLQYAQSEALKNGINEAKVSNALSAMLSSIHNKNNALEPDDTLTGMEKKLSELCTAVLEKFNIVENIKLEQQGPLIGYDNKEKNEVTIEREATSEEQKQIIRKTKDASRQLEDEISIKYGDIIPKIVEFASKFFDGREVVKTIEKYVVERCEIVVDKNTPMAHRITMLSGMLDQIKRQWEAPELPINPNAHTTERTTANPVKTSSVQPIDSNILEKIFRSERAIKKAVDLMYKSYKDLKSGNVTKYYKKQKEVTNMINSIAGYSLNELQDKTINSRWQRCSTILGVVTARVEKKIDKQSKLVKSRMLAIHPFINEALKNTFKLISGSDTPILTSNELPKVVVEDSGAKQVSPVKKKGPAPQPPLHLLSRYNNPNNPFITCAGDVQGAEEEIKASTSHPQHLPQTMCSEDNKQPEEHIYENLTRSWLLQLQSNTQQEEPSTTSTNYGLMNLHANMKQSFTVSENTNADSEKCMRKKSESLRPLQSQRNSQQKDPSTANLDHALTNFHNSMMQAFTTEPSVKLDEIQHEAINTISTKGRSRA